MGQFRFNRLLDYAPGRPGESGPPDRLRLPIDQPTASCYYAAYVVSPSAVTYVRRPLVMRNGTSQSPLRTRFEPAHSFVPSPPAAARPRPPCGRAVRAFGAHQTLAHNGWTAFRVSLQVAFGHPPGPYASRGLLASVLRTFHSSQRGDFDNHILSRNLYRLGSLLAMGPYTTLAHCSVLSGQQWNKSTPF